jgi:hypothetical protein
MREASQYEQGRAISIRKRNNNKDLVVQTAVHNLKLRHNIRTRDITLRQFLEGRTSRIKNFQSTVLDIYGNVCLHWYSFQINKALDK